MPWHYLSGISLLRRFSMLPGRLLPTTENRVDFVVEPRNWSIAADGMNISSNLSLDNAELKVHVTEKPYLTRARIVHFGSQFMFENWCHYMRKNQSVIVTFFHGRYGDDRIIDKNLEFLLANQGKISRVIVSFEAMRNRLIALGLDSSLITLIPIGVSSSRYLPPKTADEILKVRKSLGIPDGYKIIGSFQKDGEGWEDGLLPKNIKGPDLFVKSLQLISKEVPIFVLLSGPARGFVKKKLIDYGIPYSHHFVHDPEELIKYYQAIDLYIVSSREEGGPKGLIEALSVGCPVVSTPVGVATDMKSRSVFFSVLKSFEVGEIASESVRILNRSLKYSDRELLRAHSLKFDWKEIARLHFEEVYLPLILKSQ